MDLHVNVGKAVPAMVPGGAPGDSERRDMPTEYVRGYQDQSGGSHMFALWTRQTPPDEDDTNGWAWVRADKVMWVESVNDRDRGVTITKIVFDGCFTLRTDAPASDVRWGIDLALNGGKHRDRDGQ